MSEPTKPNVTLERPVRDSQVKIVEAAIESGEKREGRSQMRSLPEGVTVHAIERTQTFGPKRSLEGEIIVELADGSLHRLTGRELSDWSDVIGPFIQQWRLPE